MDPADRGCQFPLPFPLQAHDTINFCDRLHCLPHASGRGENPPSTSTVESVTVDVIEEAAPGVITITEFEETEVREEGEVQEWPEETRPESEGDRAALRCAAGSMIAGSGLAAFRPLIRLSRRR
jgi:hypothetical protein